MLVTLFYSDRQMKQIVKMSPNKSLGNGSTNKIKEKEKTKEEKKLGKLANTKATRSVCHTYI